MVHRSHHDIYYLTSGVIERSTDLITISINKQFYISGMHVFLAVVVLAVAHIDVSLGYGSGAPDTVN